MNNTPPEKRIRGFGLVRLEKKMQWVEVNSLYKIQTLNQLASIETLTIFFIKSVRNIRTLVTQVK